MLNIDYRKDFLKTISKIKDGTLKEKVKKQIEKVLENPGLGKPMRHNRKGTRELYVAPYRLSYAYFPSESKVIFLDLYHKDNQ